MAAINGVTVDAARASLRPYGFYYASNTSDRKKPLATSVDLYNSRVDLQSIYPEVLMGEFRGLIGWANEVLSSDIRDEAYFVLKPYEVSYPSLSVRELANA